MAPPRKKSIRDELLKGAQHPQGKPKPNEYDIAMRTEALILVQSGMLMTEAAEKTGVSVHAIRSFINGQYYLDLVKTYDTRLQACQEQTLKLMEEGIKSLHAMQGRVSSGTWLEEAEPDRINALANLIKVTSDSTFRLIEAANRAQGRLEAAREPAGELAAGS